MNTKPIPLDVPNVTPIQIARACYWKWQTNRSFTEDLADYLDNGIVINRPDIFAMAKITDDGQTLFVRMAVGNLRTLLSSLPVLTPWIAFHRRNEERTRKYLLVKLLKTTDKLIKKEKL